MDKDQDLLLGMQVDEITSCVFYEDWLHWRKILTIRQSFRLLPMMK
jgi:hypothetical protein